MKKNLNFSLILVLITILSITVSCKKSKDPEPAPATNVGNSSTLPVTPDQSFTKKWTDPNGFRIGAGNRVSAGTSPYAWFEFSPYGIYMIMMTADSSIVEGAYTYDAAANKLILDNFGEIQITTISSTNFSFTVTPTGGTSTDVLSSAASVVDQTSKTLQFARIWKLTSQTDNGVDTGILTYIDSAYVIVTKYGTHMLALKGGLLGGEYIPQVWKWSDATQANICVGDFVPDCSEPLSITLTSDNKMIAVYTSSPGVTTREEYEELIIP
jgi:hypothetical protein